MNSQSNQVATASPMTPLTMLQEAVNGGADLAIVEKLMELQERHEARLARQSFDQAFTDFKAAAPKVLKNQTASMGGNSGYQYATLDQVAGKISEALSEYGLAFRWNVEQIDNKIRVTCILRHQDGHQEQATLESEPDKTGSKNSIQAIGSAKTYLEKYTLLAVVGLAAGGQDDDGASADMDATPIDSDQLEQLVDALQTTGSSAERFCHHFRINLVSELPATQFKRAMSMLDRRKANIARKGGAK